MLLLFSNSCVRIILSGAENSFRQMEFNRSIGEVVDYDSLIDVKSNFVAKAQGVIESIKTAFSMPVLAPIAA